ncbi:MAG: BNR/Asp-box repeat domain protein [Myxococcaceae bacterium]|nr:BNR/Asp-box repeat domain protein [Myxococcaceae bacterium]
MLALRRTAVALLVSCLPCLPALPLLTTLAIVCSTRDARANGRFPQAQAFETVPGGDGSTIFLRTTFGILVSRDAGETWHWICERALGYDGSWDPPIAVTRDGRLWVGLERGLVSTLDGCTVETATELDGEQVKDLTVDPKGETLWALTGAPEKAGAIWRRSPSAGDGGTGTAKWQRMGTMPDNINPMTIEVAPSRPSRIYVSGQPYGTVRGWLWRSDDGGKTITGAANALEHAGPFFIAAVDPKDPNRVLLRHLHTTGSTVLVTPDGGKTFKEVLAMDSAMFGFAKSGDGLTYFAGSGLPQDGIFRSTDRGEHFERVTNHGVLCLHDAPGGRLFVCENPATLGGPAIALSRDRGATVSTIATFADVRGPIACGADAGTDPDAGGGLCAAAWPETRTAVLPRAPRPTAASDGGYLDGAAGRTPDETPARRSTCGCEVVGSTEKVLDHAWLTTGLLPLVVWGRARNRRGSRRDQRGPAGSR